MCSNKIEGGGVKRVLKHRIYSVRCAPAPFKMTMPTPLPILLSSMFAALESARVFDSGDMIMVAGLLVHPESSLKVGRPNALTDSRFRSAPQNRFNIV